MELRDAQIQTLTRQLGQVTSRLLDAEAHVLVLSDELIGSAKRIAELEAVVAAAAGDSAPAPAAEAP